MLNGINLFETRHYFENFEFEKIELKYDYKIPPILKVFYHTFKWKELDYNELSFYFYPFLKYGDIQFYAHSIEDMIKYSLNTNDDDIIENKLLYLATGYKNIFVGTKDNQIDKIILDDSGEFIILADNIFTFLRGITDNLVKTARTKEEYMTFMSHLGFEGTELEEEGEEWKKYNP
ncbi:MAG: hypothetical protein ACJATI_002690 [Halioglobus sp.]|jgi:hypothetical protein